MPLNTLKLSISGVPSCTSKTRLQTLYANTAYSFDSVQHAVDLFDLKVPGDIYTRLSNPSWDIVEKRIAALEGGVGALLTSSGQSAILITMLNFAGAGDEIITSDKIYGGTYNLFAKTFKQMGINVKFINSDNLEDYEKAITDRTKCIYVETLGNPSIKVADVEALANIAHKHGIPLVVDNTVPTPYLCKPIDFGADIVVHSTTKYLSGHGNAMGGVIVDSGKFDWAQNDKFKMFTTPDESYHGVVYTRDFGAMAFIIKARMQLMRDFGCYQTPQGAFLLNLGLETLALRMERYSQNALEVAQHLKKSSKIESVSYPGLPSDIDYPLTQKYLKKGANGVITFVIKGGRAAAVRFMDAMKLASRVVHVADIRTCVLHPASSTL